MFKVAIITLKESGVAVENKVRSSAKRRCEIFGPKIDILIGGHSLS